MHRRRRSALLGAAVATLAGCADFEPKRRLVIPVDERPVTRSEEMPAPVIGGTLEVLRDGRTVVAADPDRDRLSIVDGSTAQLLHTIPLEAGDEPGRVVEGADGIVHAVLRGADAVVTVDVVEGRVLARRATCVEPRGVAWDAAAEELHVACASGTLVTFSGDDPIPARRLELETDLRDVLVTPQGLVVTRFRSAEILRLSAEGEVVARVSPPTFEHQVFEEGRPSGVRSMAPAVAWRAIATPEGDVILVHQRAQEDTVEVSEPTAAQPSAYGGGSSGSCTSGIVESAVTRIRPSGQLLTSPPLLGTVLPVDVAVSDDGTLAVANAGLVDSDQPRPFVEDVESGSAPIRAPPMRELPVQAITIGGVDLLGAPDDTAGCRLGGGRSVPHLASLADPVVAVTFLPGDPPNLVAQVREPAKLMLFQHDYVPREVDLGGPTLRHTGHEIFHRDAGAGIACASCHPEGAEDGHTWVFDDVGPRRTQTLLQDLGATAPFHWDGSVEDVAAIMEGTLVGRMGGVRQSPERLDAVREWLFSLEPLAPVIAAGDSAVERGRALFEQSECGSCHTGPALTDNRSHDVGTGDSFQPPSLAGVAYRAPYLHDGCAATLHDALAPDCGGPIHGEATGEVDDLVAYLRSL